MKKIGIVSSKGEVAELLEEELRQFLGNDVEFVRYVVTDENVPVRCDVDVVLLSGGAVAKYVYTPFNKSTPVLSPRRTVTMQGWRKLRKIPEGTSALIVNDTRETAEETVSLFKEFGLLLDLHPYYPGCKNFPKVSVAITPGETKYVPSFVKKIIDVGNRIFDPSVILELLLGLGLFEWKDLQKLSEYSKEVKSTQPALQKFLLEMAAVRLELETVLSVARQAVMAYSEENGKVIFFNRFAEEYTHVKAGDAVGKSVKPILKKLSLKTIKGELLNEIIELNGVEMVLNVKKTPLGTVILSFYPVELHREIERKHVVKVRKSGMRAHANFSNVIGGEKIQKIVKIAKKMALSDAPILLEGESGTGKELFAQAIHNYSKRSDETFVPINCASLSEELLESELFGYVEGAFTGAKKGGKLGLFEVANNGTIFLDEISEMPLPIQSKLLRVLQEKEIIRVGGTQLIPVNARVIAATNGNLFKMMEEGRFRMDLFYRISTFQLRLPPLRERMDDLETLVSFLIEKRGYNISIVNDLMSLLKNHDWPGNVREVENFVDYVGNLFTGKIELQDVPPYLSKKLLEPVDGKISANEVKVLEFIKECGNVGRGKIARSCNLSESEVRRILEKLSNIGYISVARGRKGTALTQLGYHFISLVNK